MVKISESKPNPDTNFIHLVGDDTLAALLSQIQSALIKCGNALEKSINHLIQKDRITTLDTLYRGQVNRDVEVIIKPHKPKSGNEGGIKVDYAVIIHSKAKVILVELKSSSKFDTQKQQQIYDTLNQMSQYINHPALGYQIDIAICVFYATDGDLIHNDFKHIGFRRKEVLIGLEFCNLIGVRFEDVMREITTDQPENKNYILMATDRIKQGLPINPEEALAKIRQEKAKQLKWHFFQGQPNETI